MSFETGEPERTWWQVGLAAFAELTGWIAVPIVAALYVGRWLDAKKGTEPWFFLGCTGVAFVVSCIGIGVVGIKYMRQIEQAGPRKQGEQAELYRAEQGDGQESDEHRGT